MKKILIVEPPFYSFFKYDLWNYAFTASYIAAILKEKGNKVLIYDADKYFEKDESTKLRLVMVERQENVFEDIKNENHYIWQHYKNTLLEVNPDCIIFSTWTFKIEATKIAIKMAKEVLPNCKIGVGGYHVTALPHYFDSMSELGEVDGIFIGPAENIIQQWIEDGCPKRKYFEAVSKDILKMKVNPDRDAFLYKEFFSPSDFKMAIFSRGCYNNCSFCSNKMLSKQNHAFSSDEYIRNEIDIVKNKYGNTSLSLADAHFFESHTSTHVIDIIKEYNMSWECALRVDSITPKFADKIADAGCKMVFCGLERGRNDLLRNINKKITIEKIQEATQILLSSGIMLICSFVVGFPDETKQSMNDTEEFALSLGATHVSLNSFTPLPGSILWDDLRQKYTEQELLDNYNQLNPKAKFIEQMDSVTYASLFKKMLNNFENYNTKEKGREKMQEARA